LICAKTEVVAQISANNPIKMRLINIGFFSV